MPNSLLFARSLFALHQAGLLREPACKGAIKTFIRQASEDPHWHVSAHYRSIKAAEIIALEPIASKSQYQAFCRKKGNKLRHEHMVPGEVVYKLLIAEENPSVESFNKVLSRTSFRATITEQEDKKLLRFSVPDFEDFRNPNSPNYLNHLVRYIHAKIDGDLVLRPDHGWFHNKS